MYFPVTQNFKQHPVKRWNLPDRVFFACGACHILAHAFLTRYSDRGYTPVWIKPDPGFSGNHIVCVSDESVFDYHGYSRWPDYVDRYRNKARKRHPGWDATLIDLPMRVLISEAESRQIDGLWLRGPEQFLHNAMPRAVQYLERFDAPALNEVCKEPVPVRPSTG